MWHRHDTMTGMVWHGVYDMSSDIIRCQQINILTNELNHGWRLTNVTFVPQYRETPTRALIPSLIPDENGVRSCSRLKSDTNHIMDDKLMFTGSHKASLWALFSSYSSITRKSLFISPLEHFHFLSSALDCVFVLFLVKADRTLVDSVPSNKDPEYDPVYSLWVQIRFSPNKTFL